MQKKTLGLVLVGIGILMMLYTGFTFITKEKVVDVGPIQIDKNESHPVRWSPIVGAILLIGGIAVLATNKNKG